MQDFSFAHKFTPNRVLAPTGQKIPTIIFYHNFWTAQDLAPPPLCPTTVCCCLLGNEVH